MTIPPRPQEELERTYNAAADHYDHPAVSFWDRYGRRTVDRLPLISGMAVLDVCCGMVASAIRAAERVGPAGHVVAVDLAEKLLNKDPKGLRNKVSQILSFAVPTSKVCHFLIEHSTRYSVSSGYFSSRT
jgi:ubiquinone/menaquinone biosynthesis C-methylase UbiE